MLSVLTNPNDSMIYSILERAEKDVAKEWNPSNEMEKH